MGGRDGESSRGKRERGTKAVAVKLQSKKVDWRLSGERKIIYVSYIEASINKSVRRVPVFERYWFELRITVDPVIILPLYREQC